MLGHYLELLKAKWDKLGPVVIKEAGDEFSRREISWLETQPTIHIELRAG
jgi:hypothetical protein